MFLPVAESDRNKALSSANDFLSVIPTVMNENSLSSAVYLSHVNSEVDGIQSTIVDRDFGWVNSTTSTFNATSTKTFRIRPRPHNFWGDPPRTTHAGPRLLFHCEQSGT